MTIAIEGISLSLGAFALDTIDVTLDSGQILVVLGPNGSGKSVLLETVAGFHRPDAGRVRIRGIDVTRLPPERRRVGFVVQNFGLFPHLTVEQNVRLALRPHATEKPSGALSPLAGDATALLSYFGVSHLAARTPGRLSPGEKQRVALARALAANPDLFLFDEPFSALDAQTREQLRDDLLSLLRQISLPAIFVTHDHTDALTLADRVLVLRNGRTVQAGAADDVYRRPADMFVARFTGVENILSGRTGAAQGDRLTVSIGDLVLQAMKPSQPVGEDVHVCIRAEAVRLRDPRSAQIADARENSFTAKVTTIRRMGALTRVDVGGPCRLTSCLLTPQLQEMALAPGMSVSVDIAAEALHLVPAGVSPCAPAPDAPGKPDWS
jgi:molybdate/tungstate transport system ATP-binding protein